MCAAEFFIIANFTWTQTLPLPTITDPNLYQRILTYLTYVNAVCHFGTPWKKVGSGKDGVFGMGPLK